MTHLYTGDVYERAVAKEHLETRLALNKKYQSTDFDAWLFARLNVALGETVLDVGCGTGAQTIPLLKAVGPSGYVCALDIAEESVKQLKGQAAQFPNLTAVASDMGKLGDLIKNQFPRKKFGLAQSSYALYYSPERLRVLDIMCDSLTPEGRVAVFTPNRPHGMVELARKVGDIPAAVDESLGFGPSVLEGYFRAKFWDVTVHFFHNIVRVTNVDDAIMFYRSTTYYNDAAEPAFRTLVQSEIDKFGVLEYEKNGYLIIGKRLLKS